MPHHHYVVTSAADTKSHGSLRSAILYANAHPGTKITFAATLAHHTITLSHELPLILGKGTVIDGGGAPHHFTFSHHLKTLRPVTPPRALRFTSRKLSALIPR